MVSLTPIPSAPRAQKSISTQKILTSRRSSRSHSWLETVRKVETAVASISCTAAGKIEFLP